MKLNQFAVYQLKRLPELRRQFFLMEHETFRDNTAFLIVDDKGAIWWQMIVILALMNLPFRKSGRFSGCLRKCL